MASTPFGEHLKRERELRGVSLDEIAAATRIKTNFLEALEDGRWSELPGGAFNRGFIRATARFLGLDEDAMLAEYALETGGELDAKTSVRPSGAMPRNYRPAVVAGLSVFVLLVALAWLVHHEIFVHRQKRAAAVLAASMEVHPAAEASPPPNINANAAGNTAAEVPSPPADASANKRSDVTAAVPGSDAGAPEPLKLRLQANKTTEIRVLADGKILFKGRLHSDEPRNFEAHDGFEVSSNDVAAVRLQLNGEDVAFAGKSGHRGSIALSRKDLKSALDSSH